jgi:hypothetical protein
MKVCELIEVLRRLDPDLPVVTPNGEMSGEWLELDATDIEEKAIRPAEHADDIYVKAGESWPGSLKAVVIG